MRELVFSVRQFLGSNLGWFKETRKIVGEQGRERAVNINAPVFSQWFSDNEVTTDTKRVFINCRYIYTNGLSLTDEFIYENNRPIALQGAGKNWRLAGDAIEGEYYGTIRIGDLMLMMFNRKSKTLSWMVIRGADNSRGIIVPQKELEAHNKILDLLGKHNADRNMWLPSPADSAKIFSLANEFYTKAGELLMDLKYLAQEFENALKDTGFVFQTDQVTRFLASVFTKRFVIFTGLSGSGKTKLAQAFASWICESKEQYAVIPVGPDWTSNEQILGYPDALDNKKYVKTQTLDLMIRATKNNDQPHFVILDEMNLSHVERYFADILSAIESEEPIHLHSDKDESCNPIERDNIPCTIKLPTNLFFIGTVNVDETTYMFSPKVLDRVNVIEFRVSKSDLSSYLEKPTKINLSKIERQGAGFSNEFVRYCNEMVAPDSTDLQMLKEEILQLFDILSANGWEFGYRTIAEVSRYMSFYKKLTGENWNFSSAFDSQILQKVLPKLHGSRKKLETVLTGMAYKCYYPHRWDNSSGHFLLSNKSELQNINAIQTFNPLEVDDHGNSLFSLKDAQYPLSFDKLCRMLNLLEQNGFTSFAEG